MKKNKQFQIIGITLGILWFAGFWLVTKLTDTILAYIIGSAIMFMIGDLVNGKLRYEFKQAMEEKENV